jgi:hypothetical protein
MQERQRVLSRPISPIRGDGNAAATRNSGGDVLFFEADQQAQDMGTQVLSHASIIFFFKLWQTPMFKTFYLTCVYLNYIQGSKSNTTIISYSHSQSFTGFPEEDFSHEDWNAKAAALHNMGDDSTPIRSHQEAGNDSQRAPNDGDDGHIGDGGAEHSEEVLPNVMVEEAVDAEAESTTEQQVQHLNHFLFISVISYFFYLSHFLHCPSIRFLEAQLATLLVLWGR